MEAQYSDQYNMRHGMLYAADTVFVLKDIYNENYTTNNIDINYSIELTEDLVTRYLASISHNARKNLRQALASELTFRHCSTQDEIIRAYNVIAENRSSKGSGSTVKRGGCARANGLLSGWEIYRKQRYHLFSDHR